MIKKCNKCNQNKNVSHFHKLKKSKDGYRSQCKECRKKDTKKYRDINKETLNEKQKKYYQDNKEKVLEYQKKYSLYNKEEIKNRRKIYRNNNKEIIKRKKKKYYQDNKEKIQKYQNNWVKTKKETDSLFALKISIRSSISNSFRNNGFSKRLITEEILGCNFEEFKVHLENQFDSWMNWENKGLFNGKEKYGWDIDHIKPLNNAANKKELIELNHFSNLQPLCSYYNRHIKWKN